MTAPGKTDWITLAMIAIAGLSLTTAGAIGNGGTEMLIAGALFLLWAAKCTYFSVRDGRR